MLGVIWCIYSLDVTVTEYLQREDMNSILVFYWYYNAIEGWFVVFGVWTATLIFNQPISAVEKHFKAEMIYHTE